MDYEKTQQEQFEAENCYGLYSQQEDTGAFSDDKLSDSRPDNVFQNPDFQSRDDKVSPIPSDLLMNSALSAAHDINKDECAGDWYSSGTLQRTYSAHSKHTLLRETSRSESSLYQENSSASDTNSIKELQSDTTLQEYSLKGPSASFSHRRNVPRKGHNRSKSDQVGVLSVGNVDQDDGLGLELSLPASKSLPRQMEYSGKKINYLHRNILKMSPLFKPAIRR